MVDILMATYNGAKYVDEQIRSFCRQTYTGWRCIVHDDGSTDGTQEIVRAWAQRDKRIVFIEDGITGLQPARHFLYMLRYAEAPWIMWSDQDDVWFDTKIETMLQAAQNAHFKGAGVVYSNAQLWSPEKGVIAPRNTLFYPTKLRDMLFLNSGVQGAAALFNAPMRQLLMEPLDSCAMHDHVLLLAALTMGETVYIDRPLMYYRQHADNVTGNAPGSKRKKLQLMWTNRHIPVISRLHYEGTKAFYEHFKPKLCTEDRQVLETYLHLPDCSWLQRLRRIHRARFTLFGSRCLLIVKLFIRRYI